MTAYHAKKRLGQNFLVSTPIIESIIDQIAPRTGQTIIEIGSGRGALTVPLAESGARVVAVEFDSDVVPYLRKLMRRYDNVEIIHRDFLSFEPDPEGYPKFSLVGNLPYNITSPVLDWCVMRRDRVEHAVFMVQKEMALRIGASPGGRNWSPLSIVTQLHFDVSACFDVPPESFRPPPKVTSSVIKLVPRISERIEEYPIFERVVRASFARRRKQLKNNLVPAIVPDTATVTKVFDEVGLGADCRAEELSTESFLKLTKALIRYNIL